VSLRREQGRVTSTNVHTFTYILSIGR
jgi:hypothetical protein